MHTPNHPCSAWIHWSPAQWQGVSLGGLRWVEADVHWSIRQDARGRSLLMLLLQHRADAQEVARIFAAAAAHADWEACLALEDDHGVRLCGYGLRYAVKRFFYHGSWIDAVMAQSDPVSSRGHGLLRQLASLAESTLHPQEWVIDQLVVSPQACAFSAQQWQAGLDRKRVLDWFSHRVFAINGRTQGTLNGPATPDLHLFYNLIVQQHAPAENKVDLLSWRFGLAEGILVAQALDRQGVSGLGASTRRSRTKQAWDGRSYAVETLWECFEHGDGVIRDMLAIHGDQDIWDEMIAYIQSRRCAAALDGGLLPARQVLEDNPDRRRL